MNQQQILDEFWALKFKAQVTFPIYSNEGKRIGTLVPLSVNYVNYNTAKLFAEWRQNNMESFLTHFVATPERTLQWLKYDYLLTKDRVMFILITEENEIIGHYGITHATPDEVHFDNGLRGTDKGCKGFMTFAEIAMLSYVFNTLRVPKVIVYVLSNNKPVRLWHNRSGYTYIKKSPLKYTATTEGGYYSYNDTINNKYARINYIGLLNTPKHLIEKMPWVPYQYDWENKYE